MPLRHLACAAAVVGCAHCCLPLAVVSETRVRSNAASSPQGGPWWSPLVCPVRRPGLTAYAADDAFATGVSTSMTEDRRIAATTWVWTAGPLRAMFLAAVDEPAGGFGVPGSRSDYPARDAQPGARRPPAGVCLVSLVVTPHDAPGRRGPRCAAPGAARAGQPPIVGEVAGQFGFRDSARFVQVTSSFRGLRLACGRGLAGVSR